MMIDVRLLDAAQYAGDIHGVFQLAYKAEAQLLGVTDFPPLDRSIENIADSNTVFQGIWSNRQLAAVVEVEQSAEPCTGEDTERIEIHSLAVHPNFLRRGLGSLLTQAVIKQHPTKNILVQTASLNLPAVALYQKLGFIVCKSFSTPEKIELVQLRYNACPRN